MAEHRQCIVVGGGPAGIMLGLLLARAGVEVTVLEKHGDFLRDFRGDTVHPSTLTLLQELGLMERFQQLPQSKVEQITFPSADGQVVLGDLSRLATPYPYIAMVPQWNLLNLLAEAAAAEPTFELRRHTEAFELLHEDGAVVGVRYRNRSGEEGELRASLTVACDGRDSTLRRRSGLAVRDFNVPFDAWWFRLPRKPEDALDTLTPRGATGAFGVLIPREGYFQLAYLARKGSDPELRAAGVASFRQAVARLFPQLADRVDSIATLADVKHLDCKLNRLRRWHKPGLLLLGDAAHAMSPVGGVGINLAIQDAVAAATLLAPALRQGRPSAAVLKRVQLRRLLPTIVTQELQRALHRAVIGPALEGRRAQLPRALVQALQTFPPLSSVPAYLVGVGILSEHAPAFARPDASARAA